MKRTSATSLILLALLGGVGAGFAQVGLAAAGQAIITTPLTLPLALAVIGILVVLLARPIRRMTRQRTTTAGPVDPFYATRIVMLAKASALSGALITGAGAGLLIYLLTRSVTPGVGSFASTIAAIAGAAVLLAGGLVAEYMCRIPPGDDSDDDEEKRMRVRS
ncbi:MAG: DUF3180 domain-containing protein [Burkholderiaceae bacterium]|nr:DUF3180 domain-containing protein [Microbacteriaceae bacterium]